MDKDLFKTIDTIIRNERLYAQVNLMREDIMQRFGIGRHHLNDQRHVLSAVYQLHTHGDCLRFAYQSP